jgi:L-alanine-DL-glutamate epimerase-like enolase superfamily enzyme
MLTLSYSTHELPFVYPFRTAHGLKTVQPTLVVKLGFKGLHGYGEATEIVYYNMYIADMIALLEKHRRTIESYSLMSPDRFHHFLHHLIPENNFLICALDMAAWDLYAKLRNKQIHECWSIPFQNNVLTDYTIGIDTPEAMLEKMKANPWPIYKVKLGTVNDLHIIESLRKNTDSIIRIDANAGWQLSEALALIPKLKDLGVELIEQPLAKDAWNDMKVLFEASCLPLIADEACVVETDVAKCCEVFHGINIKLTKCGGITPALRMVKEAKAKNKLVMMGCMNESMIGSAAMAQFIPQLDYLDADGPLLHSKELAEGLEYKNGQLFLGLQKGLGIKVLV